MVLGTYYAVSRGQFSTTALLAGLPLACTVANILHANNIRDLESDRLANKRTLAVRFGMERAKQEYAALTYGAYILTALLVVLGIMPWPTLVMFATLPNAYKLVKAAFAADDPATFHRIQGQTAQLHLSIGIGITLGWLAYVLIGQALSLVKMN
jgi:1,4-dihydroxy-2-naphthoate polyprenyltransferase